MYPYKQHETDYCLNTSIL